MVESRRVGRPTPPVNRATGTRLPSRAAGATKLESAESTDDVGAAHIPTIHHLETAAH